LERRKSLGYQINTKNQQKNHPFQGKGMKKDLGQWTPKWQQHFVVIGIGIEQQIRQ